MKTFIRSHRVWVDYTFLTLLHERKKNRQRRWFNTLFPLYSHYACKLNLLQIIYYERPKQCSLFSPVLELKLQAKKVSPFHPPLPCSQTPFHLFLLFLSPAWCQWWVVGLAAWWPTSWLADQNHNEVGQLLQGHWSPVSAPELRAAATRGGPHPEPAYSALWNGFTPHADQTKLSFSSEYC